MGERGLATDWGLADIAILALVVGLGTGTFMASEFHVAGAPGFPLDDAYIHLQMARNLSAGHGFSFNADEPVAASTAPLWTLLVALLYSMPGDVVTWVKGIGALLLFSCAVLTLVLGRELGLRRGWALLGALAVALTPRLLWAAPSGMEVLLYAALATGGILLHLRHFAQAPSYWSTVLFAAAALARPECLILFPLAVLDRWRGGVRLVALLYWRHALLFSAMLAPYFYFNMSYGSGILPNTFYAKVGAYGLMGALRDGEWLRVGATLTLYPLEQCIELARFAIDNSLVLAALVPLGLLVILKKEGNSSWFIPLVVLAFPILRGIFAPFKGATFQHGRYAAFFVPLFAVAGVLGAQAAWQLVSRGVVYPQWQRLRCWGGRVLVLLVLGNALVADAQYARIYAANVADINRMHVSMGRWLNENTPSAAVVATNDIGAIAYYSERRIIDIVGLASPETLTYLQAGVQADQGVLRLLMDKRPDYLVILPNWYPQLAQMSYLFRPVHEVVVEGATIAGGHRLVAYRTIWAEGE